VTMYYILAERSAASVFGAAAALYKVGDVVQEYDTGQSAARSAFYLNEQLTTPNVSYRAISEAEAHALHLLRKEDEVTYATTLTVLARIRDAVDTAIRHASAAQRELATKGEVSEETVMNQRYSLTALFDEFSALQEVE
jgi:hypothetical protein